MVAGRTPAAEGQCVMFKDWDEPSTLALLALLIGLALGSVSGGFFVIEHYDFQADNVVQE
jgi:hypothetical protein